MDRMNIVQDYLELDAKNVEQRSQALIERAKQRLQQYRDGNLSARVAREWQSDLDLTASLGYDADAACPACAATGTLEGEDVLDTEVSYSDEPDDVQVTLTIGAEYFSCPTCRLVLMDYKLIKQAGLPEEFEAEGDVTDIYEEPETDRPLRCDVSVQAQHVVRQGTHRVGARPNAGGTRGSALEVSARSGAAAVSARRSGPCHQGRPNSSN